jgi:hypothetical protein
VPEALAEQGKVGAALGAITIASDGQGLLIFLHESLHMFTLSEFLQLFAAR